MEISIQLPDEIAQQIGSHWTDIPRRALEAPTIESLAPGLVCLLLIAWGPGFTRNREKYLVAAIAAWMTTSPSPSAARISPPSSIDGSPQ